MNEVKKCSISGISFSFDKEAYARLEEYTDSLKKAYAANPDGKEILADIEARIAELILSAQSEGGQIVHLPLVENIILQLGCADEISDADADTDAQPVETTRIARRLYRDADGAKLGGVCNGLGKYFNVDTALVRLAASLPLLLMIMFAMFDWDKLASIFGYLFVMTILAYIFMWFAIPVAKTARQKLEMCGEPVTARNIGGQTAATSQEQAQSSIASVVTLFGRILVLLLKLFTILLVLPLIFLIVVIGGTIIGVAVGSVDFFEFCNAGVISEWAMRFGSLVPTLGLIVLIIPVVLLLYIFIALILNKRPRGWIILTTIIVWILTILGTLFAAFKTVQGGESDEVKRIMNTSGVTLDGDIDHDEYMKLVEDASAESIDR